MNAPPPFYDCAPPTLAEVVAAEQAAKAAAARARLARSHLQLECTHSRVIEAASCADSGLPSFRVCLLCGLGEQGWACGHSILAGPLERSDVLRTEARALVSGKVHGNTQFVVCFDDPRRHWPRAKWLRAALAEALGLGEEVQ